MSSSSWDPTGLVSWFLGTEEEEEEESPKKHSNKNKKPKHSPTDDHDTDHDERKHQMLSDQRDREIKALSENRFVKGQMALYLHKASGREYEARVLDVHFDDGPANPYYTIQYYSTEGERLERQTTRDRLSGVEWNEDLAWAYLEAKQRKR